MKKLLTCSILIIFSCLSLTAKDIPEFTESVKFSADVPALKLADLRGKVLVILFFQSWCPKCNEWSGDIFKDAEEAYQNDKNVILIGLKTDGGGVAGAENYAKSRMKSNRWIIGTDDNATFYKLVTGKDELFQYVIVDGQGEIREHKYAGSKNKKNGKSMHTIACYDFSKDYHIRSTLPADKKYHENLEKAIFLAELGSYREAVMECRKAMKTPAAKDSALELENDIYQGAITNIKDCHEKFKKQDDPQRFTYFQQARSIMDSLKTTKVYKEATDIYFEMKKDETIDKELRAEKMYLTLQAHVKKLKEREGLIMKHKVLPQIVKDNPNTYYGQIAEKELAELK